MKPKLVSIQKRMEEIDAENEKRKTEHPEQNFLKFVNGLNEIEILSSEAEEGKFGLLYEAIVNGEKGVITLKGKLEEILLERYLNGDTTTKLVRTGEGKETRYMVV